MKTRHATAIASLSLVLLFTAASVASADDASSRAASLIDHQKATIATLAHPTATLQRIELVDERHTTDGLRQEYEFYFESLWGKAFHCTLDFDFNSRGEFAGDLTVKGTTAFVQPFAAANAVVEIIRKGLLKDPDVNRSATLVAVLREADAETLCEIVLRFAE